MANGTQTKAINAPAPPPPARTLTRSVQQPPVSLEAGPGGGNAFVLWMASIADTFSPWGKDVVRRDRELRDFWPTESYLAGAVYTCAISNASLEWELDGPDRTVEAIHEILNQADFGRGWREFAVKVSIDLYSQDNAAIIEVIRQANSATAPILGIAHLDSARCQRTGDLEFPVIYHDTKGNRHKMPWYSVITLEEFPSPIASMYGVQYSAVTRVLRSAQVLRDIAIYRGEKAGGRFAEAIHILGGVKTKDIEDIQERAGMQADNQGLVRYLKPIILGSLDPGAQVSVATLDLKSLPEGFDFDKELRWYINSLALGFGRDYQDFAPLSSGNLGTSQQSEVLHMKARGKGPAAFMRMLEQAFNFHGIMPRTVTFRFKEQDIEAEQQQAKVKLTRAETRKIMIESLEISPVIARQIAADDGDLKPEYLQALGEGDVTPDETVEGGEKPAEEMQPIEPLATPEIEPAATAEKALLRSLVAQAETSPILKEYLQRRAIEIAKDPVIAGLKGAIQETSELLQIGLIELQQAFDARLRGMETHEIKRSQAMDLAVKSLAAALKDLESQRKTQRTVEEIEADVTMIDQTITKRDRKGRAQIVTKRMASGKTVDYKVIRDRENGEVKRLERIG